LSFSKLNSWKATQPKALSVHRSCGVFLYQDFPWYFVLNQLLIERNLHKTIIKALESHPRSSVDLLICIKSFVNSKIATSPLVKEKLFPILFSLMATYREEDANCKKVLNSDGQFLNLPMLNLALEILRMVLESGFIKQTEDTNIYADIVHDLNLQAFSSFLELLSSDWISISRSLKSQFIMYLTDKNVGGADPDSGERLHIVRHHEAHFQLLEPSGQDQVPRLDGG
jgi:hypothetical protein